MSNSLDKSIWRVVRSGGFFLLKSSEMSRFSSFRAETVECSFSKTMLKVGNWPIFLQGGQEQSVVGFLLRGRVFC